MTNSTFKTTGLLLLCFMLLSISANAIESNIISAIKVEGNRLVDEKIILLNISVKVGDKLDADKVQEDIGRLGEMGYFTYVSAEVRPSGNGKEVVFKVEENEVIGEIEIKGCTKVSDTKLMEAMESKIGSVFNSKLLTQDIQNVNDALSREGYLFSKVSDAYVQDHGRKINIEIVESILTEIKIEGLKKTKEKVIRRELITKTGEIYDNKKVVRDLQRIYNTGFFEEVRRDHRQGKTPLEIILVIQVVEKKTGKAGLGAGYSSLNGVVGFVNASQDNFNGEGKRVYAKTEFGGVETYEVGYFDPWLNDRPQSFGIDLYNTQYSRNLYLGGKTLSEYDENRKGAALTLGKRLTPDVDLTFRFRDEDIDLKTTDGADINAYEGVINGRMQTFAAILSKDTRDNRFGASRGLHDTLWVETTGGPLRGKNEYTKWSVSMCRYMALNASKKTIFALQGVYGHTNISDGFVPIYNMFSVGGSSTVRGYEEREFLGTRMFCSNFELRQSLASNFGLVLFYDMGSAWGTGYKRQKVDYDLKKGYGIGLRIQTPLGLVALDHGKAEDRGSGETYINFGSSF